MTALVLAIAFTLIVSAICSLLEAFILSITVAEIEDLKQTSPKRGLLLEKFKRELDETSSAILTLNTIANTMGATLVGAFAAGLFNKFWVGVITGVLVFAILIFAEIIPKNVGSVFRDKLKKRLVYPLKAVRFLMYPFSAIAKLSVRLVMRRRPVKSEAEREREIILLAEKHAKEGSLTFSERDMISNALKLDELPVREIMTPRTVLHALEAKRTLKEVAEDFGNLSFARMPVYEDTIDNIVGVVRRRDLLIAHAENNRETSVRDLAKEVDFVPDNAMAADSLQLFLKKHRQFAVVVDEFGSTVGVVTMEDIVEHILGREIFERDDVAVDMREFARNKAVNTATPAPPTTEVEVCTPAPYIPKHSP